MAEVDNLVVIDRAATHGRRRSIDMEQCLGVHAEGAVQTLQLTIGRSWSAMMITAILALATACLAVHAQTEPQVRLRVVGGLGKLNQYTRH